MADVVVDSSKLDLRLGKLQPAVHDELLVSVTLDAGELLGEMQSLASGDLVQVRTGKFRKSFKASIRQRQDRVQATVGTKSLLAHILEGGASIPPHEIAPSKMRALMFQGRSGRVFARSVKSPGGKIAARHIVQTAFDNMKGDIEQDLIAAARKGAASV